MSAVYCKLAAKSKVRGGGRGGVRSLRIHATFIHRESTPDFKYTDGYDRRIFWSSIPGCIFKARKSSMGFFFFFWGGEGLIFVFGPADFWVLLEP